MSERFVRKVKEALKLLKKPDRAAFYSDRDPTNMDAAMMELGQVWVNMESDKRFVLAKDFIALED